MKHQTVTGRNISMAVVVALALILTLMLTACAAPGSYARQGHFPLADSEAALDYEQADWGEPFWEDWIQEAVDERIHQQTEQPGQPAKKRAANSVATSTPATVPGEPGTQLSSKLGVYLLGNTGASSAAAQLVSALQSQASEHGLIVIGPTVMSKIVSRRQVCSASPADCLAALAVYPGIRALLVMQIADDTAGGAVVKVHTRLMDTDFGISYPARTTRVFVGGFEGQGVPASAWAQHVMDRATRHIARFPWLTHAFTRKDGNVYISAGRGAGLTVGAELEVHTGGSLVRAPGGRVVAWQPGDVVGRLKVKKLLGPHIAVTKVLSGRAPQPHDKITLAGE